MSYTFDSSSGATFDQLKEMVLTNAFSASKYGELAETFLNDGVTEACKRLGVHRTYWILNHDAAGAVTMPNIPFWRVEEVWRAESSATASASPVSANAFASASSDRLEANPWFSPAETDGFNTPSFFSARRTASPTSRYPQISLTVMPCNSAGKVAVTGLVRPPVMSLGADLSGLGADLDWALVCWAKARLFALEDDPDMFRFNIDQFEDGLKTGAIEAVGGAPRVTPGTWEDGVTADAGR